MTMLRCAIYVRVSTEEQAKDIHYSLPTQEQGCRNLIAEHADEGWVLDEDLVFRDAHTGTELFERPEVVRMLRKIAEQAFDVLVIYATDRMTREIWHGGYIRTVAERHGVIVVSATRKPTGNEFADDVLDSIELIVAKHEKKNFHDRSMRGREARIKSGKHSGIGKPPYGYIFADERKTKLTYDPKTRDQADFIFRSAIAGMSLTKIAQTLNDNHVPTPSGRAAKWNPNTVKWIINNETYKGELWMWRYTQVKDPKTRKKTRVERPKDQWVPIPDGAPAYVTPEEWDQAQARLRTHKRVPRESTVDRGMIFTRAGQVVCGHCGSSLARNEIVTHSNLKDGTKKTYRYPCYTHYAVPARLNGCPTKVTIRSTTLDQQVWEALLHALDDPDNIIREIKAAQEDNDIDQQVASMRQHLAKLDAEHKELARNLGASSERIGKRTRAVLEADANAKEAEIEAVEEQLDHLLVRQAAWYREVNHVADLERMIKGEDRIDIRNAVAEEVAAAGPDAELQFKRNVVTAFNVQVKVYPKDHNPRWELYWSVDTEKLRQVKVAANTDFRVDYGSGAPISVQL